MMLARVDEDVRAKVHSALDRVMRHQGGERFLDRFETRRVNLDGSQTPLDEITRHELSGKEPIESLVDKAVSGTLDVAAAHASNFAAPTKYAIVVYYEGRSVPLQICMFDLPGSDSEALVRVGDQSRAPNLSEVFVGRALEYTVQLASNDARREEIRTREREAERASIAAEREALLQGYRDALAASHAREKTLAELAHGAVDGQLQVIEALRAIGLATLDVERQKRKDARAERVAETAMKQFERYAPGALDMVAQHFGMPVPPRAPSGEAGASSAADAERAITRLAVRIWPLLDAPIAAALATSAELQPVLAALRESLARVTKGQPTADDARTVTRTLVHVSSAAMSNPDVTAALDAIVTTQDDDTKRAFLELGGRLRTYVADNPPSAQH